MKRKNNLNLNKKKQEDIDWFTHILKFQKTYLLLLLLITISFPLISNLYDDGPSIKGSESYYHLSLSKDNINVNPLSLLVKVIPFDLVRFLPIILIIGLFFLFHYLSEIIDLSKKFTFFFSMLMILSAGFIYSSIILSSYLLFILLVTIGFILLVKNHKIISIIPLILASLFDVFSSIILLTLLTIFLLQNKKKERTFPLILIALVFITTMIGFFFLAEPLTIGPFHQQSLTSDLISDFGGLSGISFFTLFLTIGGLGLTWKKKRLSPLYSLVPIVIFGYLANTNTIFYLTLACCFFAAIALVSLYEREWSIQNLKKFTFLLVILGILFSTFTFVERTFDLPPTLEDQEVLEKIKIDTTNKDVILSSADNTFFIKYFAQRKSFPNYQNNAEITSDLFEISYINELFPILDENNVTYLFINEKMKQDLPEGQGILFLIKNERFKWSHSSKETEAWVFKRD